MRNDEIYNGLNDAFGCATVHSWPAIPRAAPRWWQRGLKAEEKRINAALAAVGRRPITDEAREIFWREIRKGQDISEDAGGYKWRCWCAALGLPHRPATLTYSGFISADHHVA